MINQGKAFEYQSEKDVFRCPRCGFSGGVFDLYAHYAGIPREEVREALIARLNVQGDVQKERLKSLLRKFQSAL